MTGRIFVEGAGSSATLGLLFFLCSVPLADGARGAGAEIPVPRPKPAMSDSLGRVVPGQAVSQIMNDRGEQGNSARVALSSCFRAVRAMVPRARRDSPFRNAKGCGIGDPVVIDVVSARGSGVALSAKPMLGCKFAQTFATWISDVVAPLARQHLGASLASIHVGPGYNCRTRNRVTGAKLSEHSYGKAIDLMSFRLTDKRRIAIGKETSADGKRFLRAVRTTACGYFTTVLGPGSNAAHATHFHVDTGKHGRSGHYRICE